MSSASVEAAVASSEAAPAVSEALKDLDLNKDKDASACAHCAKAGASKRCAKRHSKCLKKVFCDKPCEEAAHRVKAAAKATPAPTVEAEEGEEEQQEQQDPKTMTEQERAAKARKKKAKKAAAKAKKAGSDQFWWNNSVYASW